MAGVAANMSANRPWSNSLGATLVETLIAISISAIVIAASASFFTDNLRQMRVEDTKGVISDLAARLREDASNPDHLRTSADLGTAPGNVLLRNCLSSGCIPAATDPNGQRGIDLIRLERTATNAVVPVTIAGPKEKPTYYTLRGEICDNLGVSDCLLMATASFWASCPLSVSNTPQASCPVALTIHVRVRVFVDNGSVKEFYQSLRGTSFPNLFEFNKNPSAFAVSVAASDIIQKAQHNGCGLDKVQVGFDTSGVPLCQCIAEFKGRTVRPTDQCSPAQCPKNTYLQGFDPNKNPPLKCAEMEKCSQDRSSCAGFDREECPCKCLELSPNDPNSGNCPAGMWMTELNFGACYATSVKKGNDSIVRCEKNIAICCRLPVK